MKTKFITAGLLFLIPFILCLPQDKGLKKITFMPSWVPQPQFAGYYMAKEKGIYEKYGLDVTIIAGDFEHNVLSSLQNNQVDFGIMFLYTGVMSRAKGIKIVNIAQIFQQSGIVFVAKKKSGIKTLKDFNGKKIGIWRTTDREMTNGFLKAHNINAEIIPFDKGVNIFLKDAVDICTVMRYNEYKRLINSGINPDELEQFNFNDYGMNFPEDGIYCMESTFDNDPDLCRKFTDASIEGWNYAIANIDETIQVINRYQETAHIPYNMSQSLWMLNSVKEMIKPIGKNVEIGKLQKTDFEDLSKFLYQNDFIDNKPDYDDFYKGNR